MEGGEPQRTAIVSQETQGVVDLAPHSSQDPLHCLGVRQCGPVESCTCHASERPPHWAACTFSIRGSVSPPRCCHSDQTRDVPEATRWLFSLGTQCWTLGTPMLSQVVTRWCVLRLCRKPHGLMAEPGSRRCRIVGRQISCQSRRGCHGAVERTPYPPAKNCWPSCHEFGPVKRRPYATPQAPPSD